jgi:hypothetical protein
MRQLETSTLSNQNIAAYLLVHTYTADADRAIFARVHIDQVAGNGDYSIYCTIQAAGAGSAFMEGPVTTFTVPAAQTAIGFVSILVPVNSGDVVKFYVKGLGTDTTTPDVTTRIFELTYLRPTTAGNTLDVSSTGEVGLDLSNIKQATTPTTLTDITIPIVTTLSNIPSGIALEGEAATAVVGLAVQSEVETAITAAIPDLSGLATSTEVGEIKTIADKLDSAMEVDGTVNRFTENALELGPVGSVTVEVPDSIIEDIWTYARRTWTQPMASYVAQIDQAKLTYVCNVTFDQTITDLVIPATWSKIIITIKKNKSTPDTAALFQFVVSNPPDPDDGLVRVNSVAQTGDDLLHGYLDVDQSAGEINIYIDDSVDVASKYGAYTFDVKALLSDGESELLVSSTPFIVALTETRRVDPVVS